MQINSGTTYRVFRPDPDLRDYIRFYWALEGKASPESPYIHRTLANAFPELIFHYKGPFEERISTHHIEKTFTTGIHGHTDRLRLFQATSDYGIFGIFLQPYSVPAIFGIPSVDLINELPDLASVLGQEGSDLSDRIMEAESNVHRIQIMNQFFRRRITDLDYPDISRITNYLTEQNGNITIPDLAAKAFRSQRQLERVFHTYIGFSPKTYARIIRFNSILWNYDFKNKSMTQIAHDFGYFDQAHFSHDFKNFSGYSPGEYFSGKATDVFYAPGHDDVENLQYRRIWTT
ncbi:MAG TPA: helix-turn-helix domain-containing protein [Membranihabitans sp.]|nr:helix-turn-helix domain-containing protein [Membranihabitans sp.]